MIVGNQTERERGIETARERESFWVKVLAKKRAEVITCLISIEFSDTALHWNNHLTPFLHLMEIH